MTHPNLPLHGVNNPMKRLTIASVTLLTALLTVSPAAPMNFR